MSRHARLGAVAYRLVRVAAIAWPLPYTLAGLLLGVMGLVTGGRTQYRKGVIEFYAGGVAVLLGRLPVEPMAMTLGHVILGRTAAALDLAREHEHVHVRQYERWGPLFGPAYLLCSLVLWFKGRDAYRENPFEREAYDSESF